MEHRYKLGRNWNKLVSLEDGWDIRTPYEQTKNLIGNYGRILSYIGEEMNIIYGRGYERAPEGATYVDADNTAKLRRHEDYHRKYRLSSNDN